MSRLELLTLRCAPFGVPVVPDVRIVVRPWRDGAAGSLVELRPARSKIVASPSGPLP